MSETISPVLPKGLTRAETLAINWNDVKDQLDLDVWYRANNNTWWPERIPVANDLPASRLLIPSERLALTRALTGLTYLDTMQAEVGLPNMQEDVAGDPERQIELHVYKQFEFMESVHAKSYSTIFSTLLNSAEIEAAFLWSRQNKHLQTKGAIINDRYRGTCELERRQASVFLESFLFYSGFFLPLLYSDLRKLTNTGDIIKLINR